MRKILLNGKSLPESFQEILNLENINTNGKGIQRYVEEKLIEKINHDNPKMKVREVEYFNFKKNGFENFLPTKYSGIIVDEKVCLSENEKEKLKSNKEAKVFQNGYYYEIRAYIYFTSPKGEARNSVISQAVFPSLLDYIPIFIDSPMYSIVNHPIYCIDLINKPVTEFSIKQQICGLNSLQVKYINLFNDIEGMDIKKINNLEKYLEVAIKENESNDYLDTADYFIDFKRKEMILKNFEEYVLKIKNGKLGVFGSNEKFYTMRVLPPVILALNEGYKVECDELIEFYKKYYEEGLLMTDKIKRFKYVFNYIDKLRGAN